MDRYAKDVSFPYSESKEELFELLRRVEQRLDGEFAGHDVLTEKQFAAFKLFMEMVNQVEKMTGCNYFEEAPTSTDGVERLQTPTWVRNAWQKWGPKMPEIKIDLRPSVLIEEHIISKLPWWKRIPVRICLWLGKVFLAGAKWMLRGLLNA
jgi:hypothetical protein